MRDTLYKQAWNIEELDKILFNGSNQIDVAGLQRLLFQKYEKNPILYNAVQGKQTIEGSLEELAQVNKGIRIMLPWRKDKGHNERLDQLGELISRPSHLHKGGVYAPDNLITTGSALCLLFYGGLMLIDSQIGSGGTPSMVSTTFVALALGFASNMERFSSLPTEEAKYLDGKVKEFYK